MITKPEVEENWYHRQRCLTWTWRSWSWSFLNFWQIFLSDSTLVILFLLRAAVAIPWILTWKSIFLFIILRYFIIRTTLGASKKDSCLGIVLEESSYHKNSCTQTFFWKSACVPQVRSDGLCILSIHSCNLYW